MSRNSQVARIYRILQLLEGAPHGLTIQELTSRLENRSIEVSKRTIYRDVEALKQAGFPLIEKGQTEDQGVRWALDRSTKVSQYLTLEPSELVSLYLIKGSMAQFRQTPFYEKLESVFEKIEVKLGPRAQHYLNQIQNEMIFAEAVHTSNIPSAIIDTLHAACSEKQLLKINYNSLNSRSQRERIVGPYCLYLSNHTVYLLGQDQDDMKNKVFSILRIDTAEMLEEEFYGEDIDAQEYFSGSMGIYSSGQEDVVTLKFFEPIATYISERQWHSSQILMREEKDYKVFQFKLKLNPELVQWVMSYGKHVQVIEPAYLKKEIFDQIAGMQVLYQEAG